MYSRKPFENDLSRDTLTSIILGNDPPSDSPLLWVATEIGRALSSAANNGLGDDVQSIARSLRLARTASEMWTIFSGRCPSFAFQPEMLPVQVSIEAAGALVKDGLDGYQQVLTRYTQFAPGTVLATQIGNSDPVLEAAKTLAQGWYDQDPNQYWDRAHDFICEPIGHDIFYASVYQECVSRAASQTLPAPPKPNDVPILETDIGTKIEMSKLLLARALAGAGVAEYVMERNRLLEKFGEHATADMFDKSQPVLTVAENIARGVARNILFGASPQDATAYTEKTLELMNAGIGEPDFYNYVYFDTMRGRAFGT